MWYPATVTVAASSEPVTLAQARTQCRVDAGDGYFDDDINRLIAAARAYVEKRTNSRLYTQTVAILCDSFADMARLPEGPVQSISSVTYIDTDGDEQTLSTSVYELRADGLEAAIVLKYNQVWPSIQLGSRITVTAVVGYASVPDDVLHSVLLLIADWFRNKEVRADAEWSVIDSLLVNHRRGI